jgi:hypothetical protein
LRPWTSNFRLLALLAERLVLTECLSRCAGRLSSLADQCQSSPSLMALATVPNVGSLVSFVCGQSAAIVEKCAVFAPFFFLSLAS